MTIGETMRDTIVSKYGSDCDVTIIHHWADGERIQPHQKAVISFPIEHDFLDELTVLYYGLSRSEYKNPGPCLDN